MDPSSEREVGFHTVLVHGGSEELEKSPYDIGARRVKMLHDVYGRGAGIREYQRDTRKCFVSRTKFNLLCFKRIGVQKHCKGWVD